LRPHEACQPVLIPSGRDATAPIVSSRAQQWVVKRLGRRGY
jgi:hypothetical protein